MFFQLHNKVSRVHEPEEDAACVHLDMNNEKVLRVNFQPRLKSGVGDGTGMKQPRWITGARIVSSRGFADPKSISEKQMYFLSGRKIDDFAEF